MRNPILKCRGILFAAVVLVSAPFGGSAQASRCGDASHEGLTAFHAAAQVQTEMRRLIRSRAPATRRLEVIDREIALRQTVRAAVKTTNNYCNDSNTQAAELRAVRSRNFRRLSEAQCQRLGFQARAVIDDAKAFQNADPDRRRAIRDRFRKGYDVLKAELASTCPDGRKQIEIQLAKVEHHALRILTQVPQAREEDASHDDAYRLAMRHYKTRDYRTAARYFVVAAEGGNARAQYYLGRLHMEGWGVEKSDERAAFWFKASAAQGDPAGQNSLGLMYDLGRGVPEDDAVAVQWYQRAASQGLPFAQTNLGQMYEQGEGVRRDLEAAVKLYRTAADRGHVRAHYRLGRAYERGLGVKKDLVTAITFYRRAADRGYKPAQQALAALGD